MEVSRLRLLFLIALAATTLPGCALFRRDEPAAVDVVVPSAEPVTGEPSDKPIIDPQVERREIRRTRIDTEDFELGAYVGVLSIEDFESNVVYGARLAYHLTEGHLGHVLLPLFHAGRRYDRRDGVCRNAHLPPTVRPLHGVRRQRRRGFGGSIRADCGSR